MKSTRYFNGILFALCMVVLGLTLSNTAPVSADAADDFVITVQTDKPGISAIDEFTIPINSFEDYDYGVDCNNDLSFEITDYTESYTCDYGTAGTYTIRIRDNSGEGIGFPRIYFDYEGDREKLISIDQWGTGEWSSMAYAFDGCENLTVIASDTLNLSNVTDMSFMFRDTKVFNAPIGDWDTSSVENMSHMFSGASAFNQPIGNWDVSSVKNMNGMFQLASSFNQPIGNWDTSSVMYMSEMFSLASAFNQMIGNWNTSNVEDMNGMFAGASAFNASIGDWDVSSVKNMNGMFAGASAFNASIGDWDTGNVSEMFAMFLDANAFNQNLGSWDVSALITADFMFLNIDLSTIYYDSLLKGWNSQTLQPNVNFDGGESTYCFGESARQHMMSSDGWNITDGGKDCSLIPEIYLPLVLKSGY